MCSFDIVLVSVYFLLCLWIGLYRTKSVNSLKKFAINNGSSRATFLTCIMLATIIGAGTTIGSVENVFMLGMVSVVMLSMRPLTYLSTSYLFGNNIEKFKGCLSVSHVMYKLYGHWGRGVAAVCSLLMSFGVIAVQALAAGQVFNYFLGIDVALGVYISYSIMALYSALGGIRSVVLTEVFQFIIFFFVIPVSCTLLLKDIGGVEVLISKIPTKYLELEFTKDNILLIMSFALFTIVPDFDAPTFQRYLMASSTKELKKSLRAVAFISLLFALSLCAVAYITRVMNPNINPAEALLYYTSILPVGLKGLMVAGLFAIIMSTAEAWINSAAVILVNDVLIPLRPKFVKGKELKLLRIATLLVSALSVAIALNGRSILELIWLFDNIWTPVILIPLAAGFLGYKANVKTFLTSVGMALLFTVIGGLIAREIGIVSLSIGLIGSASGFVLAYRAQKRHEAVEVYARIRKPRIRIRTAIANYCKEVFRRFKEQSLRDTVKFPSFVQFSMACYFIYSIMLNKAPSHDVLIWLLIAGFVMASSLLLIDILLKRETRNTVIPYLWYLNLIFCLPLVSTYIFFSNATGSFWSLSAMLLTLSVLFFVRALNAIFIITVGVLLGYGLIVLSRNVFGIPIDVTQAASTGYIFSLFLIVSVFFSWVREKRHEERIAMMQMIGGTIAHEMNSPIASMTLCAGTIRSILSKNTKKEGDLHYVALDKLDYEMLATVNDNIEAIAKKGVNTVNSILVSMKGTVIAEKKFYSLKKLVKAAVSEYSLLEKLGSKVELILDDDFMIETSDEHFKHVIINLLKNAYKYGGRNVAVKIEIRNGALCFTDYGAGISPEVLPHIFERFYTGSQTGTGLGLAFCKMVMEDMGGDIICRSRLGKFTEFKMLFQQEG